MRVPILTGLLLLGGVSLTGCDKVKNIEEKINSEVKERQQGDDKSKRTDSQTARNSGGTTTRSADSAAISNSTKSTDQSSDPNREPKSSAPQFPELAAEERPAAEALAAAGGKLIIENGVVTELSLRGLQVQPQHMSHVFKLTHLKKLDLATSSVLADMLVGVDALRQLEFIDLTGSHANTQTFIDLLKIPTMNFMVFDKTEIDRTALDALVRDKRKLTLSLREMDLQFTDDIVLRAHQQTRGRVTYATSSGVLPAKVITFPVVAGVQTGDAPGY